LNEPLIKPAAINLQKGERGRSLWQWGLLSPLDALFLIHNAPWDGTPPSLPNGYDYWRLTGAQHTGTHLALRYDAPGTNPEELYTMLDFFIFYYTVMV
jgi:hypothetical protein